MPHLEAFNFFQPLNTTSYIPVFMVTFRGLFNGAAFKNWIKSSKPAFSSPVFGHLFCLNMDRSLPQPWTCWWRDSTKMLLHTFPSNYIERWWMESHVVSSRCNHPKLELQIKLPKNKKKYLCRSTHFLGRNRALKMWLICKFYVTNLFYVHRPFHLNIYIQFIYIKSDEII